MSATAEASLPWVYPAVTEAADVVAPLAGEPSDGMPNFGAVAPVVGEWSTWGMPFASAGLPDGELLFTSGSAASPHASFGSSTSPVAVAPVATAVSPTVTTASAEPNGAVVAAAAVQAAGTLPPGPDLSPAPAAVADVTAATAPASPAAVTPDGFDDATAWRGTGLIALASSPADPSGSGTALAVDGVRSALAPVVTADATTPLPGLTGAAPAAVADGVPATIGAGPGVAGPPMSTFSLNLIGALPATPTAVDGPSFADTLAASARSAHPIATAVAIGAATAVWLSTESARDRRRERLAQAVATSPFADRLIGLAVFRG